MLNEIWAEVDEINIASISNGEDGENDIVNIFLAAKFQDISDQSNNLRYLKLSVSIVVETVIKSSENLPKEESDSTSVDSSLRNYWGGRFDLNNRERFILNFCLDYGWTFTDILVNESEILNVGDVIVFVSIELSENLSSTSFIDLNIEEGKGITKKDQELFQVEFSLGSFANKVLFVGSLKGNFSAMSFQKEVGEFVEGNTSTVVGVKSKEIFEDVVQF